MFKSLGIAQELGKYGLQEAGYVTSGTIFFVDSGATNASDVVDGQHGYSWTYPFATIEYAVNQCTANAGDIIYVAPGHAETVATAGALDFDIAGISVIGLGNGNLRPTITIGDTGVATADVDLDANNVRLENLIFTITAVDVAVMIDVNAAAYSTIKNCLFKSQIASYEAVKIIDIGGTSDNDAQEVTVEGCQFRADVAGDTTTHAIYVSKNASRLQILDNGFFGTFETACFETKTGEVCINSVLKGNYGYNTDAGGQWCIMDATEVYCFINNLISTAAANTVPVTDGSASYFAGNRGTDAVNLGDIPYPATATAWT